MMKNIFIAVLLLNCLYSHGACKNNKKKRQQVSATAASSTAQTQKEKATAPQKIVVLNSNQVWMRYDETKCSNPWQLNWLVKPTPEQLASAVKSDIEGRSIRVLEIRMDSDKNSVTCDACTCPNGNHYYILVNKSVMPKLRELKFYEVKQVPEANPDNTK